MFGRYKLAIHLVHLLRVSKSGVRGFICEFQKCIALVPQLDHAHTICAFGLSLYFQLASCAKHEKFRLIRIATSSVHDNFTNYIANYVLLISEHVQDNNSSLGFNRKLYR